MAGLDASVVPAPRSRRVGSGFWVVAFAFLIVMAVATLPSPLYGLYRTRDHLSALTITLGTTSILVGLVLLVVSVRLSTPSLALFLIGGALIGGGSGAVFKGTTGIVLEASPPESRVAMTSALLIALYVGLAVPVIGAGVALSLGASPPDTVLGFAILAGLGVAVSGWALLGRRRP